MAGNAREHRPRLAIKRVTRHIAREAGRAQVVVVGGCVLVGTKPDEYLLFAAVASTLENKLAVIRRGVVAQHRPAVGRSKVADLLQHRVVRELAGVIDVSDIVWHLKLQ